MNTNSTFLKEMGISEWVSKDQSLGQSQAPADQDMAAASEANLTSYWWFFGIKPQGEAEALFQNMLRVLALNPSQWSWKNPADNLNQLEVPKNGLPQVAIAFGGPTAQKITGERDALPQLRETVLALNHEVENDIPVIATFDFNHLIARPKDKAFLWQDLLLAKSVLQNL